MSSSDLQNYYKGFHTNLYTFVSSLPGRFCPSCPPKLNNVHILCEILMPDDSAFSNDFDMVVKKYFIIQEVLAAVFTRSRKHVYENQHYWVDGQKYELDWDMTLIKMAMGSQLLNSSGDHVSLMEAGIGGINSGVRSTLSYSTLMGLSDLLDGLNEA